MGTPVGRDWACGLAATATGVASSPAGKEADPGAVRRNEPNQLPLEWVDNAEASEA
jgi:hypothetical protein